MYFLTQLEEVSNYFRGEDYFFDSASVDRTLAKIVGAKSYELAWAKFSTACLNLQIVLKFVLGFLDYEEFKILETQVDDSNFKLVNKPLIPESQLHTNVEGISNKLSLFFGSPPEGESPEITAERLHQLKIIHRFIDLEKFKESASRLTGKGRHPRTKQNRQELVEVCAGINNAFTMLNNKRKFLISNTTESPELIRPSQLHIDKIIVAKAAVATSLSAIQASVDLLKNNLEGPSFTPAMPVYDSNSGYLRKVSDITAEVPEFMQQLALKFPDKKIMYVSSEHLNKDNHFHLVRELNVAYAKQLTYILQYQGITEHFSKSNELSKQKNRNLKSFNTAVKQAINLFVVALGNLIKALPVAFNVVMNNSVGDEPVSLLAVVHRNLKLEDMPEQGPLTIIPVNDDEVVLAHAEISFQIITLEEYLRNVENAFKKVRVLSKADIDKTLLKTEMSKYDAQKSYANLVKMFLNNSFSLESNKQHLAIKNMLNDDIVLPLIRIVNSSFAVKKDDFAQIKATLKKIVAVNKKIAIVRVNILNFSIYLPELINQGISLHARLKKISDTVVAAEKFLTKLEQVCVAMTPAVQEEFDKLTESIISVKKKYIECPQVLDSNNFALIQSKVVFMENMIKGIEEGIKNLKKATAEVKSFDDKVQLAVAANPNSFLSKLTAVEMTSTEDKAVVRFANNL